MAREKRVLSDYERWMRTPTFVYTLCDPDSLAVRYVGCTISPNQRLQQHCSAKSKSKPLREWLESLKAKGKRPVMMIVAKSKGGTGYLIEAEMIEGYRRLIGPLLLNGGETYQRRAQNPFRIIDMCEVSQ